MVDVNELADTIADNAIDPKKAAGDQGSVEQHSIPDQIAAAKFAAAMKSAKWGLGIRHVKLIPPGAAGID